MPKPRKQQISLDATPFYHCVSRCVRKAWLCGNDPATGRSYEHRRKKIESEMRRLSSIFFLDLAAYAVMSNHYHVVVHVNREEAYSVEPKAIVERWHQLFSGNTVSNKYLEGEALESHEREQLDTYVDLWRIRLHSISWFMRVLNEKTARQANKEDDCTGRFWEGRYKCQALLDEQAILSCMAYVDLNPIRAGMAATPEESDYTSIKQRIKHFAQFAQTSSTDSKAPSQPTDLFPFVGNPRQPMPVGLTYALTDYLELVDWTGRQIRDDKRGSIDKEQSPILNRLNISASPSWPAILKLWNFIYSRYG